MSVESFEKYLKEDKEFFILNSKVFHQNKYDYSKFQFCGWIVKSIIICPEHGEFELSPNNHLCLRKSCPKCNYKNVNENNWLDSLNITNNKFSRNISIVYGGKRHQFIGADLPNKIVYEYLYDEYSGNLNLYSPEDINTNLNVKYNKLWEETVKRHELIKKSGYNIIYIWHSEFIKTQNNLDKLIICDNKYCQYVTKSPAVFSLLRNFLSYKVPGVEYTPAYQNGWNGINYLIDKKGFFYSGLLDKTKEFLKENNVFYEEKDNRKDPVYYSELNISHNLEKKNIIPRFYQNDIVDVAYKNRKGIIRATVSAGKTLCISLLTAKFNKPTIIYVIGLDLLKQFHEFLSSLFDEPIGYIGDGVCDIKRINIATIWTVSRALDIDNKKIFDSEFDEDNSETEMSESNYDKIRQMLKDTKLHILDECHTCSTSSFIKIIEAIEPEHIFGFSGTPYRDDNTDLLINGILGEKLIDISATELIKHKFVAQPIIKFTPVPKKRLSGASNYTSVYKEYIVENEERNNLILKEALNLLEKKYVPLVLFKQIKHGEILYEKMKSAGINCILLNGSDSLERRTEIKNKVANKEVDLLLSSVIFDIGLDLPILSGLILAGGGKSSIRALQRIGRVIRGYPGKKYAAVVDFYDQVKFLKQHSLKRCEVYESEPGFIIKRCKEMI